MERLRITPLSGPREKLSAEVRAWADAADRSASDAEVLAAFNRAADLDAAAVRADLNRLAGDANSRPALIGVLSRQDTTDAARLAVLTALSTTMSEHDIEGFARVSVRQRAAILGPTLDVLGSMPTGEALFALARVFATRDDTFGERAARLASALRADVPAAAALDALASDVPQLQTEVELAYAAAASDPLTLAQLRDGEMTPLKAQLTRELALLDERLQRRTKDAGGTTNEFDTRLRGALYEAMALTALPSGEGHQARALEYLFRRTDLDGLARLAPMLPTEVLRRYVTRSLARDHRRGDRADRARFAIELVGDGRPDLWEAARVAVVECLDEEAIELRVAASVALARHATQLDARLRRRLATMFAAFDPAIQERVVDDFAPVLATESHEVDIETFIRWVRTAPREELPIRLDELLARLEPCETASEDARLIVTAFLRERAKLEPDTQAAIDRQATEAVAHWIHRHRSRATDAIRAVLSDKAAADVFVGDLGPAIAILRADQARSVVGQLLESLGPRDRALGVVASAYLEPGQFQRIVLPMLASAVTDEPQALSSAIAAVDRVAGRRLLVSAISALSGARRRITELTESAGGEDVAALTSRLAQVLAAVDVAERAAAGNDELLRHFGAIRQAVSGLGDAGSESVPAAVRDWRLETARRMPDVVNAPADGCQALRLSGDLRGHGTELVRLLAELDQRAFSPRVVSAEARPHHIRDLESCVTDVARAGLLDDPDPLGIPPARTSLAQAAWSAWAQRHASDVTERLREAVSAPPDPTTESRLVLRIDALAPLMSDREIQAVLDDLPAEQIDSVWRRVRPALVGRTRELATLENQARSRSAAAMERIAGGVAPSLRAIESVMASYFRLRRLLADAGWKQVEDTLGRVKSSGDLKPAEHQVVGSIESDEYLVRTLGITVKGAVVDKAIVEALEQEEGQP